MRSMRQGSFFLQVYDRSSSGGRGGEGEAARPISSGRLNVLLHVDLHPINLVIYQGP